MPWRIARTLLRATAFALCLAVAAHLVSIGLARLSFDGAVERWEEAFGPIATSVDVVPANASALRLEQLVADTLEMSLGPEERDCTPGVEPGWWLLREALDDDAGASADSSLALPADSRRWLASHERGLQAVVEFLENEPTPHWERSKEHLLFMRISTLHDALLARARLLEEAGELMAAERSLAAAWRLYEDLRSRSDLNSVRHVWATTRRDLAMLERLDRPSPAWLERLDAVPGEESLRTAEILRLAECARFVERDEWRRWCADARELHAETQAEAPLPLIVTLPRWLMRPWRVARIAKVLDMHHELLLRSDDLPWDVTELEAMERATSDARDLSQMWTTLDITPLAIWDRGDLAREKQALVKTRIAIEHARAWLLRQQ